MKTVIIAMALASLNLSSSLAYANDQNGEALEGLNFGALPLPPVPEGLEEFAKANGLASPKDIEKAMKECRAEKRGPSCVNEKLKAAGFKVPPIPEGAKELEECLAKASTPEAIKACDDKYGPKGAHRPLPPVRSDSTNTNTNTSTSTSTSTSSGGGSTSAL